MQHTHEQCHICKKTHPDRFVYYKDYNELEGKKAFQFEIISSFSSLRVVIIMPLLKLKMRSSDESLG